MAKSLWEQPKVAKKISKSAHRCFNMSIVAQNGQICQKLSKAEKLQKVEKKCQKMHKVAKQCKNLPKAVKNS